MKLELTDINYNAIVVEVNNLVSVGLDTLVAFPVFGMQALVPKTTKTGDKVILFPAEVQLSDEYCKNNNLYRKSEMNKDNTKKGYIEDNGRVKAIKLGGQYSTALAMPISSLSFVDVDCEDLPVGEKFNLINGVEICKKYEIKSHTPNERGNKQRGVNKKFERVEARMFPEHIDTEHYLRNSDKIKDNEIVYVTQKLHGSSGRFGHILVKRQLSWVEKILKKLGVNIPETEYGFVAGSRRTIKEVGNENQNHFYSSDIWNNALEKYKTQIPKDFIIYGELVGYTPEGGMIQKGYTYGQEDKNAELYVYRVCSVNPDGYIFDLSFPQMKEWCKSNGFKTVPELLRGEHSVFKMALEMFQEVNFAKEYRKNPYFLDEPIDNGDKLPEEGVCVRVDGLKPYILKMKNQSFLCQESSNLNSGEADLESSN